VLAPLYNYLKQIPKEITTQFLHTYFRNNKNEFSLATASPFMGMLNSGLQLYWLKHTKPSLWTQIKYSLHLPQYLSYLFTKEFYSDHTSIGCHTGLWNSAQKAYAHWVVAEGITEKLAPINNNAIAKIINNVKIGVGLHDSSSALVPYLKKYANPFLLISTGTWCINFNAFNNDILTVTELEKDCLQFLQADGNPVKASRIFLGKEHQYQTERIAQYFNVGDNFYKAVAYQKMNDLNVDFTPSCMEGSGPMPLKQTSEWDISVYKNEEIAYNCLMVGLVELLQESIELVDTENVKHFFVDGGFAANKIFLQLLQQYNPTKKVEAIEFPQATALGAYLSVR
jgi:L-fuculokinase